MISYFICLFYLTLLNPIKSLSTNIPKRALLTGATGRTGKIVSNLLLEKGYNLCIFCRDEEKARQIFDKDLDRIKFIEGDLANVKDIQSAFTSNNDLLSHVVFMAGGEGADYKCVNYKGVAEFAKQAADCPSIGNFVVISSAWASRPYSIASLLFNSLYFDTLPMGSHFLGEQALKYASKQKGERLNYVILRAGGLNEDARWKEKYPEAYEMGLTYEQGDKFEFLGKAGRPGMCRTQLASAVVAAMDIDGKYTVEVTGSGNVPWNDTGIYQNLVQDQMDFGSSSSIDQEVEIYDIHSNAVMQLRNTAIATAIAGLTLIITNGIFGGLLLLVPLNAAILLVWSKFYANYQT